MHEILQQYLEGLKEQPRVYETAKRLFEELEKTKPLYIRDPISKRIRMTKAGKEKLGARLARVGYQVDKIKTIEELECATDACQHYELKALAAELKGKDPVLDEVMSMLPEWN